MRRRPHAANASGARQAVARRPRGDLGRALGRTRAPTASTPPRRGGRLLDRHAAADRVGHAAHRPRLQLHPDRHRRPLPAHARQAVFYPIGWDDNGLATERRVQNYFGVRGDPTWPTTRSSSPPEAPGKDKIPVVARRTSSSSAGASPWSTSGLPTVFRTLGASVDWTMEYTTIGARARRAPSAGSSRCSLAARPTQDAPTLWDVDFPTAVSQAELVDKETAGAYHRVSFHRPDGATVEIETTRPELLPAAWPSSPTPTTRVTRPGRHEVRRRSSASRSRRGPRARRPREGHGDRDDLHLRRRHRRDVVARPEPADPGAHRAKRPVRAGHVREATSPPSTRPRPTPSTPSSRADGHQARDAVVERCAPAATYRRARPITHPVKFYESGERPLRS